MLSYCIETPETHEICAREPDGGHVIPECLEKGETTRRMLEVEVNVLNTPETLFLCASSSVWRLYPDSTPKSSAVTVRTSVRRVRPVVADIYHARRCARRRARRLGRIPTHLWLNASDKQAMMRSITIKNCPSAPSYADIRCDYM